MKQTIVLFLLFTLAGCGHIHPPLSFESYQPVNLKETRLEELKRRSQQGTSVIPNSVAVKTFLERGSDTGLGLAATEFFTANLSLFPNLTLIDRSYSEILDTEFASFDAARQRQVLGAEQLLAGYTIMKEGKLNVGLLTLPEQENKYQVISRKRGNETDFFRLVADLNIFFLEKNGITVSRDMAERLYQVPTENIQAYVLYARGRQAEYAGKFQEAAEFYRQARSADPDFKEPRLGMRRIDNSLQTAAAGTGQEQPTDLLDNPAEQPPDFEEKNVPPVGTKGKVTISIDLPVIHGN